MAHLRVINDIYFNLITFFGLGFSLTTGDYITQKTLRPKSVRTAQRGAVGSRLRGDEPVWADITVKEGVLQHVFILRAGLRHRQPQEEAGRTPPRWVSEAVFSTWKWRHLTLIVRSVNSMRMSVLNCTIHLWKWTYRCCGALWGISVYICLTVGEQIKYF